VRQYATHNRSCLLCAPGEPGQSVHGGTPNGEIRILGKSYQRRYAPLHRIVTVTIVVQPLPVVFLADVLFFRAKYHIRLRAKGQILLFIAERQIDQIVDQITPFRCCRVLQKFKKERTA
jgi:hypothetical protein